MIKPYHDPISVVAQIASEVRITHSDSPLDTPSTSSGSDFTSILNGVVEIILPR